MEEFFELEIDASNIGLGAVLMQKGTAIAYGSRVLNKAEQNYGITEKEVLAALWAMEKFQYYLKGKKFLLITDHNAIEFIKTKSEFGSPRIQRWFSRLEQFNFDIKYRKGSEMVSADALSRAFFAENEELKDKSILKERILQIHTKLNHRKNIEGELRKLNINICKKKVIKILNLCRICLEQDKKYYKLCKFIHTKFPGEKMAFDILEIGKGDLVVMGIDYFTRKLFAKSLTNKEAEEVVEFIKSVYKEFPFKSLIADNGREFHNNKITKYCNENNIHYHSLFHTFIRAMEE